MKQLISHATAPIDELLPDNTIAVKADYLHNQIVGLLVVNHIINAPERYIGEGPTLVAICRLRINAREHLR